MTQNSIEDDYGDGGSVRVFLAQRRINQSTRPEAIRYR